MPILPQRNRDLCSPTHIENTVSTARNERNRRNGHVSYKVTRYFCLCVWPLGSVGKHACSSMTRRTGTASSNKAVCTTRRMIHTAHGFPNFMHTYLYSTGGLRPNQLPLLSCVWYYTPMTCLVHAPTEGLHAIGRVHTRETSKLQAVVLRKVHPAGYARDPSIQQRRKKMSNGQYSKIGHVRKDRSKATCLCEDST